MSQPPKIEWVGKFALAIAAAVLLTGCPPNIPPGTDCWETQPGTQQGIKIPPNFFGPTSDRIDTVVPLEGKPLDAAFVAAPYPEGCGCLADVPVVLGWVDRHGDPTDPTSKHKVKQVPLVAETTIDTCIYRAVTTNWDGENTAVEVDIELIALSLKSVQPLEVVYHESTDPIPSKTQYFDIFVTQSATQTKGKMSFTPDDLRWKLAKGATKLGELPIKWDVRFVEVDAGGTPIPGGIEKSLMDQPLSFSGTTGNFLRNRS